MVLYRLLNKHGAVIGDRFAVEEEAIRRAHTDVHSRNQGWNFHDHLVFLEAAVVSFLDKIEMVGPNVKTMDGLSPPQI